MNRAWNYWKIRKTPPLTGPSKLPRVLTTALGLKTGIGELLQIGIDGNFLKHIKLLLEQKRFSKKTSSKYVNHVVILFLTETAFKLSSKQPIDYLTQLTSSIHHPEPYNPEKTGKDIVPSSNPDSPLVSFDVWSDLEEEVTNYVINSLAPGKEQFTSTSGNMHGKCASLNPIVAEF